MADIAVRPAAVAEWSALRAVRLAALTESPHLFGSSTAAEEGLDEAEWRRRTQHSAMAWDGAEPVGIVAWIWTREPTREPTQEPTREPTREPTQADLVAMWIAPGHRGRGIGAALARWVIADVVGTHHADLELNVVAGNVPAVALYRRLGFVETATMPGVRGDVLRRMRYLGTAAGLGD